MRTRETNPVIQMTAKKEKVLMKTLIPVDALVDDIIMEMTGC